MIGSDGARYEGPEGLPAGAVAFHDPDGRMVIFAPWIFGRQPTPAS